MPDPTPAPIVRRSGPGGATVGVVLAAALVLAAVGSWLWPSRPRVSEDTVRTVVRTAILSETPDQFLVVGTLGMKTESEAGITTRLLPGILDLEVGQTTVTVRVPGRVSYGLDLRSLRPRDIRYTPEGVVLVTLPRLTVFSVEPDLENAEVQVDADRWQQLRSRPPERAALDAALDRVRPALRARAEAYVADNEQPRRNAARAVERMIATPLAAAGVRDARFRFVVAPGDTLDGEGRGDR